MNRQFITFLILAYACLGTLQAQQDWTIDKQLAWADRPQEVWQNDQRYEIWTFANSSRSDAYGLLPMVNERIALPSNGIAQVSIINAQFSKLDRKSDADDAMLSGEIKPEYWVEQERNKFFLRVRFVPIRTVGTSFERLDKCSIRIVFAPSANIATDRGGPHTFTSVLADGANYQFGVTATAIYKLDYNYLKNDLKVANIDNLDPRSIRIYGNGGAKLLTLAGAQRPDDLIENAIAIVGEQDGKFDQGDYILFYAQGPMTYKYDASATSTKLTGELNTYSKESYYFLKVGGGQGLRVPSQNSVDAGTSVPTDAFDDVVRYEEDKVNLLDFYTLAMGSGQSWYGDYFSQARTKNYSDKFVLPNAVPGSKAKLRAAFAGRSAGSTSVRITANGMPFTKSILNVNTSNNETLYARIADLSGEFDITSDPINIALEYVQGAQASEGWLDFIELNVRRRLVLDKQLIFRDLSSVNNPVTSFNLSGKLSGVQIWDITDGFAPRDQKYNVSGSTAEFSANTAGQLKTFVAFNPSDAIKPDVTVGPIPNQNLHSLDHIDFAIVYHPDFKAQAERLAQHRKAYSGLETVAVNVVELYNEFAAGKKDPTAIRDFGKMLYERDQRFRYLLLFGDGSFDPRNISQAEDNKDMIPVFETPESLHPIYAHPSDDYFALLSDTEGELLRGALDISVGRFPVSTVAEAEALVNKVIAYDNDPVTLGDWHNRILYLADDEDGNVHLDQCETLEARTAGRLPFFNSEKVYLDAYQQVSTSGGQRYPDAKKAMNAQVFKGSLILNYIGHGGPRGWTQERVIDNNDIALWANENRNHLTISATCSFGGYDNFRFLSGGEQDLLKPKSGAIALFTTVRAVYISGNNRLTDAVESVIFEKQNGRFRTMGEVLTDGKNKLSSSDEDNARRFTLLGDPAQTLALPEYQVVTTTINGQAYDPSKPDTISALETVTLTGEIRDDAGQLVSNFNGRVFVTVFDKKQKLQTLGQDPNSQVEDFFVQRNIIFRGKATVSGGRFTISFIVPKDINYAPGKGKISYYAENGSPLDAAGSDSEFIVAGILNSVNDNTPPIVQVFMNDDKFVVGGVTDPNPRIFAKISDDFGINVSGTSIGHDLTSVLNGNLQELVVLNDFYESNQDDYKAGTVTYPLNNLEPGVHRVVVKAWDISNNSGEGFTEFVVADGAETALEHVLNYPNPFTTNTYFQFEHNMSGQELDVQVRIFSVSGKLVKTIQAQTRPEGYRVTDIQWDGKDDFGDRIGKGVYIYKVSVRGTDLAGTSRIVESDFEKLVILK